MYVKPEDIDFVFQDKPRIDTIVGEGSELHRRCEEYRKNYEFAMETYSSWIIDNLKKHYHFVPPFPGDNIFGIRYSDEDKSVLGYRLPGWLAPNKHGDAYPGKALHKELKELLPHMPSTYTIYEGIIPSTLVYSNSDNTLGGSTSIIGRYIDPRISYFQEGTEFRYFLEVPNVNYHKKRVIADYATYGDHAVEVTGPPEAVNWEWPEGLQAITEAEYKYIWAKYRRDSEANEINKRLIDRE